MFTHRGYLGWITDLVSQPRPHARWPSIEIDQPLLDDHRASNALMQQIGVNETALWGLFVASEWPVEIERTLDAGRTQQVQSLLEHAHAHGLRVLSGLGVYSWGFEAIIRAHPHLSRGDGRTLCPSVPESWDWQRRVIEYMFSVPIDGVSMQSSDQGRCPCDECAQWGDVEYHARLNDKVAGYVKANWPDRLVGINNWGMNFEDPADMPHILMMTQHADYLIDTHDSVRRRDPAYRRRVIDALPCAFGSVGVPNVEPPLHWERDRWFLPTLRRTAEHIQELYAEGGRALENYMHLLANPGDDVSIRLAVAVERDPTGAWQPKLDAVLDAIYAPRGDTARQHVRELFVRAEDAYFDNVYRLDHAGLVRMEPLESDHAGPPLYLTDYMHADGLARYTAELRELGRLADSVAGNLGNAERIATVRRCIARALDDCATASGMLARA